MQIDTSAVREKITLYRTDYPDTILVKKELADRLIQDSDIIWSVNKPTNVKISIVDKNITLYRTDYPDTILVTKELADRLIKESGGIWEEMEINMNDL